MQSKALTLFSSRRTERGEEAAEEKVEVRRDWSLRFKKINHLLQGKVVSDDVKAASSYQENLAKINNEGGHTKQQIFNVDETAFYWKNKPCRTFIAREEKSLPGFKSLKDRLTPLLGGNTAGDFTLKLILIYHSENARAFKNYLKSPQPVSLNGTTKPGGQHICF